MKQKSDFILLVYFTNCYKICSVLSSASFQKMWIFNPLVLLASMAPLLQLQPKWFLLRGICFELKSLVWLYFEHNAAFAFSYCSLSLTVSETFLEEFGVAFFYSEHHWFMSCCKVQWLLKNTIVTLKRWLWLCVFCSHHNNSLQVIIKLEIFFVFLTKKSPFYVSVNYEW